MRSRALPTSTAARHCIQWEQVAGITIVRFLVPSIRADEEINSLFDELHCLVAQDHTQLLLDFSGVQHFASLTIGKLMALDRKVHAVKGSLAPCGLSPHIQDVLKIMRLDRYFPIYPTQEDALQSF